jgi:hypothetical protein
MSQHVLLEEGRGVVGHQQQQDETTMEPQQQQQKQQLRNSINKKPYDQYWKSIPRVMRVDTTEDKICLW